MTKPWVIEMYSRWGYITVKFPDTTENSVIMKKVLNAIEEVLGKENIIILWAGYEEEKKNE